MLRLGLCLFSAIVPCVAWAQSGSSPSPLIERIREKMRENLERLPEYTCQLVVNRERRNTLEAPFAKQDTLRLEVALIAGRERYAWRDSKFDERELSQLVGRGAIGNGDFALHARNVFMSNAAAFDNEREVEHLGRKALQVTFRVPLESNGYRVRIPPHQARVAFHGNFIADLETLDVIRLEIVADDIPPQLGLWELHDVMEYARVPVGQSDFLLPLNAEFTMVDLDGGANRNRSEFSACRQYTAETTLSFSSQEEAIRSAEARQKQVPVNSFRETTQQSFTIPAGKRIELTLDTEIHPEKAAIGDPVRAVLSRDLEHNGEIILPKGSVALGRLVMREKEQFPVHHYVVGLEFHTIQVEDRPVNFSATMIDAGPEKGLIRQSKSLDPTFDRKQRKPKLEVLVNEIRKGQGFLHWEAKQPVIEKGLKMRWVTADESEREFSVPE